MLKTTRKPIPLHDKSAVHWRRIADIASARQWLAEGAPIADVLTVIEVRRRFDFSPYAVRSYAVEILFAARAEIVRSNQTQLTHPKEKIHAIA